MLISKKTTFLFCFVFVKRSVSIVGQIEKDNGQKKRKRNSEMRENKCWVSRNSPVT